MRHAIHYRPDIDGLRALAILPVVLFHLDSALVPGGYVGVDVFFVISGYLIASIVHREIIAGRFSFALFYERRIRRLLPALAVVLAASFVAAWLLFLPRDFLTFSKALVAASLFLANIFFWKKTDYFSDPVDSLPLLHTWSLAVEEQFYILFPPLLLLVMHRWPKYLNQLLIALFLASLVWAQYTLKIRPESAFYLPHLRAWELLSGALLATGAVPRVHSRSGRNLLALAGLMMIAGSLFALDKDTAFPGLTALPAVLGAAMIIHAGSQGFTLVGKLLSAKPLIVIGLLSYSLYLWHWPLFVFVRYYLPPTQASVLLDIALFVAAVVISALSWQFVERPFRHHGDRQQRKRVFLAALGVIAASVLIALPGIVTHGADFRIPEAVARMAAAAKEEIPFRRPCFNLPSDQIEDGRAVCGMGDPGQPPSFLLWGDSHALALAHGIDLAAKDLGLAGNFLGRSACPPAVVSERISGPCSSFNAAARAHLRKNPGIRTVVLAGYWSFYYRRTTEVPFEMGLRQLLDDLAKEGYQVVVIDQVPEVGWNVPAVLAKSRWFGHDIPPSPGLDAHRQRLGRLHALVSAVDAPNVRLADFSNALCPQGKCLVEYAGKPLYRDDHHLGSAGSALLEERIKVELRALLTAPLPVSTGQ